MDRPGKEADKLAPADSKAGGSDCRVILWDGQPERRRKISEFLQSIRAQRVTIDTPADLSRYDLRASSAIAVVSTGTLAAGDGMLAIRYLKSRGIKVIAYEDEADRWPIRTKCLPLLAGAVQLLDSTRSEFSDRLSRAVGHLVQAESQRQGEECQIRSTMRDLGMVGDSAAIMSVFRSVIRFSALSDLPVLILGETGTGKEGLARALHRLDPKRRRGPFVPVNCGAISAALADSEFFGHRRGAFTGADAMRKGLVRSADGGVLFLDEIGELDPTLQTRLLRVLQENRVLSVGEDREVEVSVRVVAAGNRDLEQMVAEKRFREDLFHRLNVLSVHLPPLRERPEDVAPLVKHFLEKYQALVPTATGAVSPDFLDAVRQLSLPGNIRQLENLVRQALVRNGSSAPLSLGDLPMDALRQLFAPPEKAPESFGETLAFDSERLFHCMVGLLEANGWNLSRSLQNCERQAVEAAMLRMQGNQSKTARLLGITPRSVYNKVHKYRLKS